MGHWFILVELCFKKGLFGVGIGDSFDGERSVLDSGLFQDVEVVRGFVVRGWGGGRVVKRGFELDEGNLVGLDLRWFGSRVELPGWGY